MNHASPPVHGICHLPSASNAPQITRPLRRRDTGATHSSHFLFPPWARTQIISPETGREVAEGERGLIRVFDLANVYSVMAIQTEDLGVRPSPLTPRPVGLGEGNRQSRAPLPIG